MGMCMLFEKKTTALTDGDTALTLLRAADGYAHLMLAAAEGINPPLAFSQIKLLSLKMAELTLRPPTSLAGAVSAIEDAAVNE